MGYRVFLTQQQNAVELKTGHLQFHLRALMDAGLVALDRRRHRYSLTERGATALGCAEDMASRLGPVSPGTSGRASKSARRSADVQ
jgi:DNA-binding MarR family transcriptional regulator